MPVSFDNTVYKPSFIDRIVLFRRKILRAYKIGKNSVMFICKSKDIQFISKSKDKCIYLKYSYPGNIQYHKVKYEELEDYVQYFSLAKAVLEEKEN